MFNFQKTYDWFLGSFAYSKVEFVKNTLDDVHAVFKSYRKQCF